MSLIGKVVSPFKVEAFHRGEVLEITQDALMGKWSVIVFYPADFTFICPTELGDLAENYERFTEIDCQVFSASTDSPFVHKAWHDASTTIQKVQFPMIADPSGKLARDFDVLNEEKWQALRGSFVVNPQGKIVGYEINDMSIGRDARELLRRVQAAQYVAENGELVCPAKWQPGADTIKPGLDLVGKL